MYGLKQSDLAIIQKVLGQYEAIEAAVLFGSRAMGNFKNGSDVDIALKGQLSLTDIWQIKESLNEDYPTPYIYDIIHFDTITNESLKEHIVTKGIVLPL